MKKLFVIGGMKCGTTSFHHMYKDHPQICPSKFKEPSYFTKRFAKGVDWYKSLFETTDATKIVMDVSPSYSKFHLFPDCANRIYEYDKEAKFVYLVRDPLERIISNVQHDILRGRLSKNQIDQTIVNDNNYIKTSAYGSQIAEYEKRFGAEAILVLQFEELRNNVEQANRRVSEFLGITYKPAILAAQNASENRYIIYYHDTFHKLFGNSFLTKLYHVFWRTVNIKVSKPTISPETEQFIHNQLQSDIEAFVTQYQLDATLWKNWSALDLKYNTKAN